ncbi:portal protein [Tumebacillus lipolyticus]|uniref:Portal protein n=1 Tax=Tumebacillus lipolyticus TaxID=1280370 RepID=A0ABW5A2B5_9BACL
MGLLEKITSFWRRGSPERTEEQRQAVSTPEAHNTEDVNETDHLYQVLQVESGRRAVLRDVERMLEDDPLVDETNVRVARKATRGGIFVTVSGSGKHQQSKAARTRKKAGRGAKVANQAQAIIDAFLKRCKIDGKLPMWAGRLISDGDLFLNVVIEEQLGQPMISAIKWTPPAIVKRNEDNFGNFPDPSRAFSEIDPKRGAYFLTLIPEDAVQHFPLWSMNHIRWKWRGGMYGRSQYAAIRKLSKQNATADDDMVVRRKTRAPQRRVHSIGSKDNPGDEKVVQKYRSEHRDTIENGRYKATTDYYHNGQGDVKNLDGDGNLDKIKDVTYLFDKQNAATMVPKGLLGFAEDINRDVLDEQKEEFYDAIGDIRQLLEYGDGGEFSGLRALIEFELLLHGIDAEAVDLVFDIIWQPLRDEPDDKVIERTKMALDAGLIDKRTAINNTAHIFGVENPEFVIMALKEEAQARGMAAKKPSAVDERDDPDAVTDSQEEDDAHLAGMDEIESEAKLIWQKRFRRLRKQASKISIPLDDIVLDSKSEEDEVYLSEDAIEQFINAVASVHADDREVYSAHLAYVYTHSAVIGGTLAATNVGLNFKLFREDIFEDLLEKSAKRVVGIDATTERQLREALAAGFLTGSKRELTKMVREAIGEVYANAYKNRSEAIARTESMWAYNRSALRMYAEAGVDISKAPSLPAHIRCRCTYSVEDGKVIIIVTSDERTCPTCKGFIGKEW